MSKSSQHTDLWWISHWAILWGVQLLLWLLRGATYFAALRASRLLFQQMLQAVMRAPLRFHDTTPKGRMLNRFGEDVQSMDAQLPVSLDKALETLVTLITSSVGVAIGGGSPFLILLVILGPVFFVIGSAYTTAVRDVRRLASTSTSPVVSTFSDLIQGAAVIRAFGGARHAMATILKRLDDANLYTNLAPDLQRW